MAHENWKELPIKEKLQYSLATLFGVASIVIGFVAFIILLEIPASVIGISFLWASVCCAIFGISLHFRNQMMDFDTQVKNRLNDIDNVLGRLQTEEK